MRIRGELTFPGDKSISHRALMLAALSDGRCTVRNLSTGADVESTRQCLLRCGIESESKSGGVVIRGGTLGIPESDLQCGNSGTTARLLTGLLAGEGIPSTLTGDSSLSKRPMKRIIDPLNSMGSSIQSKDGHLPMSLESRSLTGIDYSLPVASAQVKSAVLLAGLNAKGKTTVREQVRTRDHTEIMLRNLGADITVSGSRVNLSPLTSPLQSFDLTVPADPSTAAFFAAAAALVPGSEITLRKTLKNPTRTGFFDALERMGAGVKWLEEYDEGGERTGDLRVWCRPLQPVSLSRPDIPGIIDEIPVLAILATQAEGTTEVRGAGELRLKESDRIAAICSNLLRMGADVTELDDGFVIEGPTPLEGAEITTYGDHRVAMTFTIAGLLADEGTRLDDDRCVAVSCPEFSNLLGKVIA
ncbi:MAG: 3-phosphoshikimate 1-carboxyvinyltransferase [Kiritimatiellia bacterium]|jgi:3-phosphoshikimate 1-carboxyvinyltransferase|nr:3-phosphoshikimate 1-carboxyvinyltransferase [Kiritimatiellia bacterium]|tara:strand:- start:62 stop:1309 length:1248 start_codon:yes stop_codon:yes gene_type:complete